MKSKQLIFTLFLVATWTETVQATPNVDAALSYLETARAFLVSNTKLPADVASSRARMEEAKKLEAAGTKIFGKPKFGEPFFNCWAFSTSLQDFAGDQNSMVRNAKADRFSVYSLSNSSFQSGTLYSACLNELDTLIPKTGKSKIVDLTKGTLSN